MIRDMELVRQLFDEIANGKERYELIAVPEKFNQPEKYEEDRKIKYHLEILQQAGFVSYGKYWSDMAGWGYFEEVQLTWVGQDYYSAIKNETIWNKTKNQLQSKALTIGDASFDMIINIAKFKMGELIGIPLG